VVRAHISIISIVILARVNSETKKEFKVEKT